jgi:DNA invertase Pin-like site-specific DNA recombinase
MKPQGVGARLIRVSSDKQDTERQISDCKRWEKEQGVAATHFFEDKESRLVAEKRPEFQKLLQYVQNGRVNWVVIQSQDRLGFKHSYEFFEFLSLFLKHKVQLFTSKDGRCITETDDYTVLSNAIAGQTSTKELEEKANRTQGARIRKGKLGQFQSGMPPYGFDVICKDAAGALKWRFVQTGRRQGIQMKGGQAEKVSGLPHHDWMNHRETLWLAPCIFKERVETLKRIFRIFDSESISTLQIARRLNTEGISAILSEKWEHSKIWALLQNPAIIGRPASNKVTMAKIYAVEGEKLVGRNPLDPFRRHAMEHWLMPEKPIFEPLISEDLFWRVALKVNQQGAKRAPKNENLLLSGLLHCGRCGKRMAGQYKAKTSGGKWVPGYYNYYRCQTYMNQKHDNSFGCRNHGTLQETVMPYIVEFLKNRGAVLEEFLHNRQDTHTLIQLLKEHQTTDAQIKALVHKMQEYIQDALSGTGQDYPTYGDDELTEHVGVVVDLYEQVFDVQRKELERTLQGLEREHTRMTAEYFDLPPGAKQKAIGKLTDLETQIAATKAQLEPLAHNWERLLDSLGRLKERIYEARIALDKGSLRQQAQALRNVLERVEVDYEDRGTNHSTLRSVTVVPLVGEPQNYAVSSVVLRLLVLGLPSPPTIGRSPRPSA